MTVNLGAMFKGGWTVHEGSSASRASEARRKHPPLRGVPPPKPPPTSGPAAVKREAPTPTSLRQPPRARRVKDPLDSASSILTLPLPVDRRRVSGGHAQRTVLPPAVMDGVPQQVHEDLLHPAGVVGQLGRFGY